MSKNVDVETRNKLYFNHKIMPIPIKRVILKLIIKKERNEYAKIV